MSPTFLIAQASGLLIACLLIFFGVKFYHRSPVYERQGTANGKKVLYLIPATELQARLYKRIGKILMVAAIGLFIADRLRLIHLP